MMGNLLKARDQVTSFLLLSYTNYVLLFNLNILISQQFTVYLFVILLGRS